MTDQELLELAAKAVDITIDKSKFNGGGLGNTGSDMQGNAVIDWHENKTWNPLNDDGDAFRLAVRLGMNVEINGNYVLACSFGNFSESAKPDPIAAARRAIVRVAAAIASSGETV